VGEIWDEHDEVIEEFKRQSDGSYLSPATPTSPTCTICSPSRASGTAPRCRLVLEEIGRVPEEGDHFVYENLDVTSPEWTTAGFWRSGW
jgi:CBS domain containing-hemolysin-like protein